MIDTHVLQRGGHGVQSPADLLAAARGMRLVAYKPFGVGPGRRQEDRRLCLTERDVCQILSETDIALDRLTKTLGYD
jgi:hypothetical protein